MASVAFALWAARAFAATHSEGPTDLVLAAQCVRNSVAPQKLSCLDARLADLEVAVQAGDKSKIDKAARALEACRDRIVVERPVSADEIESPELPAEYLERFQKALVPHGEPVARCYASLLGGDIPPHELKGGQIVIEVTVGGDGRARRVALVENAGVHGLAVGCVIRELCRLVAPAPPEKTAFVLELPFDFKKP